MALVALIALVCARRIGFTCASAPFIAPLLASALASAESSSTERALRSVIAHALGISEVRRGGQRPLVLPRVSTVCATARSPLTTSSKANSPSRARGSGRRIASLTSARRPAEPRSSSTNSRVAPLRATNFSPSTRAFRTSNARRPLASTNRTAPSDSSRSAIQLQQSTAPSAAIARARGSATAW